MQNAIVVSVAAIVYIAGGTAVSFWLQEFVERWGKKYPEKSKVVWYVVSILAHAAMFVLWPGLVLGCLLTFVWVSILDIIGPPAAEKKE